MGIQVNIDDPSSYKNCAKKQYEIYVCMPPKNTIVINKLEQHETARRAGAEYFTVEDIKRLQQHDPQKLSYLQQLVAQNLAYAVTDSTPFVLCGTQGELWTVPADKLAGTYTFMQGGQPLAINQQTLNARLQGKYLDWTVVRTSAQATAGQNMACFVPSGQHGQVQTSKGSILNYNGFNVSHGKGDFIVCSKLPNGQPNLADRWVVNGEVFAATYNNQGWTDCLKQAQNSMTIADLPKLVSAKDKSGKLTIREYNDILCKYLYFSYSEIYNDLVPKQIPSYYSQHKNEYKHEINVKASHVLGNWGANLAKSGIKLNISDMMEVIFTEGVVNNELSTNAKITCGNFLDRMLNVGVANLLGAGAYIGKNCSAKEYSKALFNYLEYSAVMSISSPSLSWFYNSNVVKSGFVGGQLCYTLWFQSNIPHQYMYLDIFKDGIGVRERHETASHVTLPASKDLVVVFSRDCSSDNFGRNCITASKLIFSKLDAYLAKSTIVPNGNIVKGLIYSLERIFSCLNAEINEDDAKAIYGVKESSKSNFRLRIHKNAQPGKDIDPKTDSCTLFVKVDEKDLAVTVSARSGGKVFDKDYRIGIGRGVDKVSGLIFIDLCRLFKLNPLRTLYSSKATIKQVFSLANEDIEQFRLEIIDIDTGDATKVKVRFNIYAKSTNSIVGTRTFVIDFNYKNFDYTKSTSATTRSLAFLSSRGALEEVSTLLVCTYIANDGKECSHGLDSNVDLSFSIPIVAHNLSGRLLLIFGNNFKYMKYLH